VNWQKYNYNDDCCKTAIILNTATPIAIMSVGAAAMKII